MARCLCLCAIEHPWQTPPPPSSGPLLYTPLLQFGPSALGHSSIPPLCIHIHACIPLSPSFSSTVSTHRSSILTFLHTQNTESVNGHAIADSPPASASLGRKASLPFAMQSLYLSRLCVLTSHKSSSIVLHGQGEQREISPCKSGISFTSHNEHRAKRPGYMRTACLADVL